MAGNRLGEWVIRFRWWIIVLTVILVGAASGGLFLEFVNNYGVFFNDENPELPAFEALQDTYTKNDNVLFVLAPEDDRVFKGETLAAYFLFLPPLLMKIDLGKMSKNNPVSISQ